MKDYSLRNANSLPWQIQVENFACSKCLSMKAMVEMKTKHWTEGEIGVAIDNWLAGQDELMVWYLSLLKSLFHPAFCHCGKKTTSYFLPL